MAERPVAIRACDLSHYLLGVYLRISPKTHPANPDQGWRDLARWRCKPQEAGQPPALGRVFGNLNLRDALNHWNCIDAVAFSGLDSADVSST